MRIRDEPAEIIGQLLLLCFDLSALCGQAWNGLCGRLTEETLDVLHRRHASGRVTHGAQIKRSFARTQHKLANTINEPRVLASRSLNPVVPGLGSGRDGGHLHALEVGQHLVEDALVERIVVPKVGILSRETGVMFDREVVLVQVVEVEGRAQWVGRRLQGQQADCCDEVGSDVHALLEAFNESWDVDLLAVAGDIAVIGNRVERMAYVVRMDRLAMLIVVVVFMQEMLTHKGSSLSFQVSSSSFTNVSQFTYQHSH